MSKTALHKEGRALWKRRKNHQTPRFGVRLLSLGRFRRGHIKGRCKVRATRPPKERHLEDKCMQVSRSDPTQAQGIQEVPQASLPPLGRLVGTSGGQGENFK